MATCGDSWRGRRRFRLYIAKVDSGFEEMRDGKMIRGEGLLTETEALEAAGLRE